MANEDLKKLVLIGSIVFLLAPFALIIYLLVNNQRKKRFFEKKLLLRESYEAEIVKTHSEVREENLKTMGADLQDNIAQLLSLASLTLNSIDIEEKTRALIKIETAQAIIAQSLKELKALDQLIQSDPLVNLGLVKDIENYINWIKKSGRFEVIFSSEGETPKLPDQNINLFIFRMLQEILKNIILHSQAKVIKIKIHFDPSQYRMEIEDNGIGFNVEENLYDLPGMGLKNIQKRVKILGGRLIIKSNLGMGTIINIFIPYP